MSYVLEDYEHSEADYYYHTSFVLIDYSVV